MISTKFTKEETLFLKGWLKRAGYNQALIAVHLAEKAHAGLTRKSGEPSISHPIRITNALLSLNIDDETILAVAVLHDVLEDTDLTRDDLLKHFNKEIVDAVDLLTKKEGLSEEEYYANICTNPCASIVKIADRCHNVSTMYFFTREKTLSYIEETEEYIIPLCSDVSNNYPYLSNYVYSMKYHIESILETSKRFLYEDLEIKDR